MIKFLIKKFVANYQNKEDKEVREKYGILAGVLGIFCNLLLFIAKLIAGIASSSIAIISDAINNLSDMASSVISIISVKMSNIRADREHPFGHGRIEYIGSLIVSFIIIVVGFEFFKTSFGKILKPEPVDFSIILIIILLASILVKFWMYSYNKYIAKEINSSLMTATAKDSLNDTISTTAVIISLIIGRMVNFPIDGLMGLLVSGFIIYSGIKLSKEVVGLLLGTPPSAEVVAEINKMILEGEGIVGVHDLLVHDYGPGRVFASAHAEVPDDADIVKIHEVIDKIEQRAQKELGFMLVIHTDPISVNCEKTEKAKAVVCDIVNKIQSNLSIHDFRMVDGENQINLIFDLVVPIETKPEERLKLVNDIQKNLSMIDSRFNTVIQIDNGY